MAARTVLSALAVLAWLAAVDGPSIADEPIGTAASHGCGHARWGVKTLSDAHREEVNSRAKTTTLTTLQQKSRPPGGVGKDTPRLDVEKQVYRLKDVRLREVNG